MGVIALVISSMHASAASERLLPADDKALVFQIYKELIETNTTHSEGDNTLAAQRMAAWLKSAGFPAEDIFVGGPIERKGNLVVRLRGSGELEPFVMLAHLDVVEAKPADWSIEPFVLQEIDGYFYGRGTLDDKAQGAIWIAI